MAKRLTSLFLLLSLAGGVMAGTPLHSTDAEMMKCCDKAKSKDQSPQANATRLCCSLNCTETVPTSSTASFNFAPSGTAISSSIAAQISALFPQIGEQTRITPDYSFLVLKRPSNPKFIQYRSLLI